MRFRRKLGQNFACNSSAECRGMKGFSSRLSFARKTQSIKCVANARNAQKTRETSGKNIILSATHLIWVKSKIAQSLFGSPLPFYFRSTGRRGCAGFACKQTGNEPMLAACSARNMRRNGMERRWDKLQSRIIKTSRENANCSQKCNCSRNKIYHSPHSCKQTVGPCGGMPLRS